MVLCSAVREWIGTQGYAHIRAMLLTHSERFVNFNYIIKNIIIRTFIPRGRFGFTNRAVMSTGRLVSTAKRIYTVYICS